MSQTNKKNIHIQSRVDTPENWETLNPILLEREIGYETNGKYKIGDGVINEDGSMSGTCWNDLPYAASGDLNLENGEGENSLQQRGNIAVGNNTFAIGQETQALIKGYQIKTAMPNEDKTITIIFSDNTDFITDGITNEMIFSAPVYFWGEPVLVDHKILSVLSKNSLLIQSKSLTIVPEGVALIEYGLYGNIIFNEEHDNYLMSAFAEGYQTKAGASSHAEGSGTIAAGHACHAEGCDTVAKGFYTHAEGYGTETFGWGSHAEGGATKATGDYSHAEGWDTIANGEIQHVQGQYNIPDTTSAFIIGNGEDEDEYDEETGELIQQNRSNAMTVDWNGNAWFAGNIKTGSENKILATEEYVNNSIKNDNIENGTGRYSLQQDYCSANGNYSFAEGYITTTNGLYTHSEGYRTKANGDASHAEGNQTIVLSDDSHAEGYNTYIGPLGYGYSDIDYVNNIIYASGLTNYDATPEVIYYQPGDIISLQGMNDSDQIYLDCATITEIIGNKIYVDNINTPENTGIMMRAPSAVLPPETVERVYPVLFVKNKLNIGTVKLYAIQSQLLEENLLQLISSSAHTEGSDTKAAGISSHAEGYNSIASGNYSHAEGQQSYALEKGAHAEGIGSIALGTGSHAEGSSTKAIGTLSHAEGGTGTINIFISGNANENIYNYRVQDENIPIQDLIQINYTTLVYNNKNFLIIQHDKQNKTITLQNSLSDENIENESAKLSFGTIALGDGSHAEGLGVRASGLVSHAEGSITVASGGASHAEGKETTASGLISHAEGNRTKASGNYSHAEGNRTIASGSYSHAEGSGTKAFGIVSHAEGNGHNGSVNITCTANSSICNYTNIPSVLIQPNCSYISLEENGNFIMIIEHDAINKTITTETPLSTTALSNQSVYLTTYTSSIGKGSHAEGSGTLTFGETSHAEGGNTTTNGDYSHAEGYFTEALKCQHVQGHYNKIGTEGETSGTTGDAFIIGNGTLSSRSNAFRINYAGKPYAKSSYSSSGADYAEFFEWLDSNPNNEDRRGYFVTLDGDKIKIAEPNDYILGVISALPAVIGNGDECWKGRYILDEFGDFIIEEFEYEETIYDEETNEIKTIKKTGTKYKENPDYDPSVPYIQREDRQEWDTVGMMGVLAVRDDGTCVVNGYCQVSENGTATYSDSGYRVIKRVNDHVVQIIFK